MSFVVVCVVGKMSCCEEKGRSLFLAINVEPQLTELFWPSTELEMAMQSSCIATQKPFADLRKSSRNRDKGQSRDYYHTVFF